LEARIVAQRWIGAGALFALTAVLFGAFGAHGLETRTDPHLLDVFKTGAYYQMIHALALVLTGQRALQRPNSSLLRWSCRLLAAGILVFSGSLYLLVLTGERRWGMVTPLGGLSFMAGWALFAVAELSTQASLSE
jgi:uncharacterized membrane protein YgdD (TMEM256/DUF423 family)